MTTFIYWGSVRHLRFKKVPAFTFIGRGEGSRERGEQALPSAWSKAKGMFAQRVRSRSAYEASSMSGRLEWGSVQALDTLRVRGTGGERLAASHVWRLSPCPPAKSSLASFDDRDLRYATNNLKTRLVPFFCVSLRNSLEDANRVGLPKNDLRLAAW